jgi:hypothetical protein
MKSAYCGLAALYTSQKPAVVVHPGGAVKRAIAVTITVAAGLFAANMLGVAVAEAPTGTPLRTVSVQGTATVPIGQGDSGAAATAVYREGMAGAVADGQSKAAFLAGKLSATLGAVQSLAEGGGYINCTGGPEGGYAEYEGEQPDFGYAPQPGIASPLAAAAPKTARRVTHGAARRHARRKKPTAKKATAISCKLTAQVSLVYTIA